MSRVVPPRFLPKALTAEYEAREGAGVVGKSPVGVARNTSGSRGIPCHGVLTLAVGPVYLHHIFFCALNEVDRVI